MRAWQVHSLGEPQQVLRLDDIEVPSPGPSELLIKLRAAGLNFPDLLLCRGEYQERPDLPFVPGFEGAGVVVEAGDGCTTQPGQSVMTFNGPPGGSFADFATVPETRAFAYDDDIDAVVAAAMPITYHTCWVGLHRRAQLRAGETLLIHGGAGGVGSAAIQIGVAAGAAVIAAARGEQKAAACRQLGAHHVIDTQSGDFIDAVKERTDGRGADVIFDPVGGNTFARSTKCVAFEGRIVTVGFASGDIPSLAISHALVKNYSLVGLHQGLYNRRAPHIVAETHKVLMELHGAGQIDPLIHTTLSFEQLPEGLATIEQRGVRGKIVLDLEGGVART